MQKKMTEAAAVAIAAVGAVAATAAAVVAGAAALEVALPFPQTQADDEYDENDGEYDMI